MKDDWLKPVMSRHGNVVSGTAAVLVRRGASKGGIKGAIVRASQRAAFNAATEVYEEIEAELRGRRKAALRVIRGGKAA